MTIGNQAESAGLAGCLGSIMCIIEDESGDFARIRPGALCIKVNLLTLMYESTHIRLHRDWEADEGGAICWWL